jgi:hypothetical protein
MPPLASAMLRVRMAQRPGNIDTAAMQRKEPPRGRILSNIAFTAACAMGLWLTFDGLLGLVDSPVLRALIGMGGCVAVWFAGDLWFRRGWYFGRGPSA